VWTNDNRQSVSGSPVSATPAISGVEKTPAQTAPPRGATPVSHARTRPAEDFFEGGLARASAIPSDTRPASPTPRLPNSPLPLPGAGLLGASSAAGGGGGGLLFGLLVFAFLLAIPNAVRWLRTALALGLSPAYVAIGDRPG
jgi:uncharacterized membrane protein